MKFTPQTEEQIALEGLIKKGDYNFEVIKAEEKPSKNTGRPMIQLTVKIFPDDGADRILTDYLTEGMAFKVRHFCAATNQMQEYEAGTLGSDECVGKTGRCKVGIETDPTGQYQPKNKISDYLADPKAAPAASASRPPSTASKPSAAPALENDDIPF